MAYRHFTLQEAERLLPRLTELLLKMRELKSEHDRFQRTIAELALKLRSNGHAVNDELRQAREGMEQTGGDINALVEQVHELGCEVKGIDEGLVDFRTLMEGREVYLCWKLGEERIGWWHDLETGFVGRRPLLRE